MCLVEYDDNSYFRRDDKEREGSVNLPLSRRMGLGPPASLEQEGERPV